MQKKFNSEKPFITIFQYLYPEQYVGEPPIAITVAHKRDFMIFFQEVQIMIRSGLMVADLAYFAFGVDAVNFWENEQKEYKKRLAKNPAEKTPVHRDEALTLFGEFVEKTKEFQRDKKHFKDRVLGIGF